mmetsp:Transcript_64284/g.168271  ORF Transcript_64284/g.168271 Transcript_64284/m.168271 type:complete len:110 (+) Transcript_64284:31-360(+)
MKTSFIVALAAWAWATVAEASTLLSRSRQTPEAIWLSAHLKDQFELGRDGRLAKKSGLNIPWDHEKSRPRNAKNDCGGPGELVASYEREMKQAAERGKLAATRSQTGGR